MPGILAGVQSVCTSPGRKRLGISLKRRPIARQSDSSDLALLGGRMRRGTALPVIALPAGYVALVWLSGNRQSTSPPAKQEDHIPKLTKLVAEQEEECAQAVAEYRLKTPPRIDDIDISVVDLLRQLPGVAQLEVSVQAEK